MGNSKEFIRITIINSVHFFGVLKLKGQQIKMIIIVFYWYLYSLLISHIVKIIK